MQAKAVSNNARNLGIIMRKALGALLALLAMPMAPGYAADMAVKARPAAVPEYSNNGRERQRPARPFPGQQATSAGASNFHVARVAFSHSC
jgi:hypothetical protein